MTKEIKSLGKLILMVGVCTFIGLIVGQFLAMPFLLFSRSDPGVPEVSGNQMLARIAHFIYPFGALVGFFVGIFLSTRKNK